MPELPIVTLTTDFGLDDAYVGQNVTIDVSGVDATPWTSTQTPAPGSGVAGGGDGGTGGSGSNGGTLELSS